MASYWATFRFHDEVINGRTYAKRYDDFIEELDAMTTKWWVEPTSFIAFESGYGIDDLASRLKLKLAPSKDLLLLRAMNNQEARIVGNYSSTTIFDLMGDYLKKA